MSTRENELKTIAYELLTTKQNSDNLRIEIVRTQFEETSGEKVYFCTFEFDGEYGEAWFNTKQAEQFPNLRQVINIHEYLLLKEQQQEFIYFQ